VDSGIVLKRVLETVRPLFVTLFLCGQGNSRLAEQQLAYKEDYCTNVLVIL